MRSEFDEDVGIWYECDNCDYREMKSSAPTAATVGEAAPLTTTIGFPDRFDVSEQGLKKMPDGSLVLFAEYKRMEKLCRSVIKDKNVLWEMVSDESDDEPSTIAPGEGAVKTNFIHLPQYPLNGTQLECDGSELRPDGTCAKCERINERIASHYADRFPPTEPTIQSCIDIVNNASIIPFAGVAYVDRDQVVMKLEALVKGEGEDGPTSNES